MSAALSTARQTMVDTQVRTNDVTDPAILAAMRSVPREAHCGPAAHLAYADAEVPYAPGRALLRPRDAGKLLQALKARAGERALAIAAPYLGDVLEAMGLVVDRTEDPVAVSGAYDVIICESAVLEVPRAWFDALADGGRLGVVIRRGSVGRATIYLKGEDGLDARIAFDSGASLLGGLETEPAFSF